MNGSWKRERGRGRGRREGGGWFDGEVVNELIKWKRNK